MKRIQVGWSTRRMFDIGNGHIDASDVTGVLDLHLMDHARWFKDTGASTSDLHCIVTTTNGNVISSLPRAEVWRRYLEAVADKDSP